MKTQYYTASSLDGFIATVDHSLEWLFQLGDINDTSYPAFIAAVGALPWAFHVRMAASPRGQARFRFRVSVAVLSACMGLHAPLAAEHSRRGHSFRPRCCAGP
jgi:hypothetical protein